AKYFDAVGIGVTRGRAFLDRDGLPGYEAAIENQQFADMFFSGRDAIGRRVRLTEANAPAAPALAIVGVVPSVRQRTTTADPDPIVYVPLAAAPPVSAVLFVRGNASMPTASLLRDALHEID